MMMCEHTLDYCNNHLRNQSRVGWLAQLERNRLIHIFTCVAQMGYDPNDVIIMRCYLTFHQLH